MKPESKTRAGTKGEATRAQILSAAVDLFGEQGFAATTMREIAASAGVATGAAYYYFPSKDAIVLAFYEQAQSDLAPQLELALAKSKDLKQRLRDALECKLAYFAPSRRFLATLAASTDPANPVSPFSPQTTDIRDKDILFFEQTLAGSKTRIPSDLKTYVPRLLWMYQMGVILFWIHDSSEGQQRTHKLLEKSLGVVVRLIQFSNLPLTQPLRKTVRELVDVVTE
jgi:AcrR family transcriptional regulator